MRSGAAVGVALLTLVACSACAAQSTGSATSVTTSSEVPSTTPALPTATSALPTSIDDVEFDPCTLAPDETLLSLGVDPASSKTARTGTGKYALLGCRYAGLGGPLTISVGLLKDLATVEEFKNNPVYISSESVTVNGRSAVVFRPSAISVCYVAMPLDFGSAVVSYADVSPANSLNVDTCPQAQEVARRIEPLLPAS